MTKLGRTGELSACGAEETALRKRLWGERKQTTEVSNHSNNDKQLNHTFWDPIIINVFTFQELPGMLQNLLLSFSF